MLIPQKPKRQKKISRKWFNKKKIKKIAKKELSTKTKNLVEKYSKSQMKQVVYSYMCPQCKKSFRAENLRSQIVESARRKDTYISCPKCNTALIVDKLMKVSTKQSSKVNRNADLISVYPNQGITPQYTPQTWIDRALLEKIAHELGKFAEKTGMFNPQLKFQRGIRGKVHPDAPENMRAAEYTIEAVDDYDLRFRVIAAAGITPSGKVVLPKYFMTLGGKEVPFTKEAVAEFLAGKVFAPADPKPVVPALYYKDRDPVRFREIVASRKTAQITWEELNALPKDKKIELLQKYKEDLIQPDIENMQDEGLESDEAQGQAADKFDRDLELKRIKFWWEERFKHDWEDGYIVLDQNVLASKKAAGTTTPGQKVEYQGKMYTVESITGDASILTDEAGTQTAPVPNTDLNIQFEEGATPAEITAPTLAERIDKLVKRSLRDEKTLVPFTEPDPDYSVAKQTDVDADFSVPYEKSDQGILPEEERAIQRMFRGGSNVKPTKSAAEVLWDRLYNEFVDSINREEGANSWLSVYGSEPEDSPTYITNAIENWADKVNYILTPSDVQDLEAFVLRKRKESSIRKTALTTWVDCEVDEPKSGYIVKREGLDEEGIVTKVFDKGLYVKFPTLGEIELFTGDDFVFRSNPYTLYDNEGDYVPVKESYEAEQADEKWAQNFNIKKTAEPTGYHETDDTGKVIELSRLRTLVQDYARAGQLPLDFDLTKVMSEVSRMTRKELLDILDKKQKDTHYPVVHAKKKTAQELLKGDRVNHYKHGPGYIDYIDDTTYSIPIYVIELDGGDKIGVPRDEIRKVSSKKKTIKSKSTNAIVQEMRKADLTEKDIEKDIKDEEEGEKHYKERAKEVKDEKAKKVFEEAAEDEAEHVEDLEEVVLPAVEKERNTENYLEKYDSRKKKTADKFWEGDKVKVVFDQSPYYGKEGEILTGSTVANWIVGFPDGSEETFIGADLEKVSSKKTAQEEEKPKVEFKELKTKPHKPELEVEEAVVATPEIQKVFHEVKGHQQRLVEIKSIIGDARRKVEEEVRKIQEEHGSVKEAEEMSQAIEKLAALIGESEKKLVDLGEFFVWLDTSIKERKFKASDKWKVEKLLEKFGDEAKKYLEKAENGAQSLNEEIKQRVLTVFPKREGSINKEANVIDSIKELGSGLWEYVKSLSEILEEGEQLEFVL